MYFLSVEFMKRFYKRMCKHVKSGRKRFKPNSNFLNCLPKTKVIMKRRPPRKWQERVPCNPESIWHKNIHPMVFEDESTHNGRNYFYISSVTSTFSSEHGCNFVLDKVHIWIGNNTQYEYVRSQAKKLLRTFVYYVNEDFSSKSKKNR